MTTGFNSQFVVSQPVFPSYIPCNGCLLLFCMQPIQKLFQAICSIQIYLFILFFSSDPNIKLYLSSYLFDFG
jgi:hypothetical protein